MPRRESRQPARHITAEVLIVGAELLTKRGFLVEPHEQVYAERDGRDDDGERPIEVPEDEPQADPAEGETDVHGIADKAVEAHDNELLRWCDRSGRAMSRPTEIPDATKSDGKAKG